MQFSVKSRNWVMTLLWWNKNGSFKIQVPFLILLVKVGVTVTETASTTGMFPQNRSVLVSKEKKKISVDTILALCSGLRNCKSRLGKGQVLD